MLICLYTVHLVRYFDILVGVFIDTNGSGTRFYYLKCARLI